MAVRFKCLQGLGKHEAGDGKITQKEFDDKSQLYAAQLFKSLNPPSYANMPKAGDVALTSPSLIDKRPSALWQAKLAEGVCHYCGGKFDRDLLTMDHIVPLARGGKSTKGNLVPSCKPCNSNKKYYTPAEIILRERLGKDITF